MSVAEEAAPARIGFSEALAIHLKIGLLSFGGPAGQIALMQDEIVTRRRLVPSESFDRALSFSMMLPGPEAQQLATWLGWRMHGVAGGLAAGLAFVVPGAIFMIFLAWLAAAKGEVPIVAALFSGVQPFVIALVLAAMIKIGQRALKGPAAWALAGAAFLALFALGLPFPLVIAVAAGAGLLLFREPARETPSRAADRPVWPGLLRAAGIATAIGAALLAAVVAAAGTEPWLGVAELFTTAAFVSFGGAYALLPYVADRAVEAYGWLTPAEMLNGLAIAEATPGPLILVNTYAGFFAGWSSSETFAAGASAAILATVYTFLPSFMLILGLAPVVERIDDVPLAKAALAGVSAAVVGVILNLAVYLAEASFLPGGDPHWPKIVLFVLALGLVFGARPPMTATVGAGLVAGLFLWATGLA